MNDLEIDLESLSTKCSLDLDRVSANNQSYSAICELLSFIKAQKVWHGVFEKMFYDPMEDPLYDFKRVF